jgi:thymidylate synthase ThyX
MIDAKVVADSLAPSGVRLTTFVLIYPRFIHSEFMTHRMFSRNASSSRAIPVKRQIEWVEKNPAIPLAFRKNQKGMQAGELLEDQEAAVKVWLHARDLAVTQAKAMADMDIHKQYANRILEPFAHISVVVTATDYDNFFALRIHPDAQPEICELAKLMHSLYLASEPKLLCAGQWHIPFIEDEDFQMASSDEFNKYMADPLLMVKRSVARCARVSYVNHEGKKSTLEEDLKLYERLLGGHPIHASPAEHQAQSTGDIRLISGNFRGWKQYRKTLEGENITKFVSPLKD